ncbi:MAG: hypothetical protein LBJ92_04045 [Holosporales bacterium]|jgi:hypothetical protein|nr:hypothetical protein [Holosporales bacterium]
MKINSLAAISAILIIVFGLNKAISGEQQTITGMDITVGPTPPEDEDSDPNRCMRFEVGKDSMKDNPRIVFLTPECFDPDGGLTVVLCPADSVTSYSPSYQVTQVTEGRRNERYYDPIDYATWETDGTDSPKEKLIQFQIQQNQLICVRIELSNGAAYDGMLILTGTTIRGWGRQIAEPGSDNSPPPTRKTSDTTEEEDGDY